VHRNAVDAVLASYEWEYDAADRIVQETVNGQSNSFGYNLDGELISADMIGQPDQSYTYDANGNRSSGTIIGTGNRLLSDGQFSYQYDSEGNLTRKTVTATGEYQEFQYDHRNRLTQWSRLQSNNGLVESIHYTYDALDRRILTTVHSASGIETSRTLTVYDGLQAWADLDSSGNPIERYVYSDELDDLVASYDPVDGLQWYLTDHQNSIRGVVDNTGTLINTIVYDPFGTVVSQSDPSHSSRFLYAGRELDSTTGLYDFRSRWYDSGSGRFLSEDPISFVGGDSNLYRYVSNSPMNFTDPLGWTATTESSAINTKEAKEAPAKIYLACMMQAVYGTVAFAVIGMPPSLVDLAVAATSCKPKAPVNAITSAAQKKGDDFFKGFAKRNPTSQTTRQIGDFIEFAVDVAGNNGKSFTRWVKVVNPDGRTVKLYHDTFDNTGRFLSRGFKVPGPERHIFPGGRVTFP
jgi:RHS repeat-associated protein